MRVSSLAFVSVIVALVSPRLGFALPPAKPVPPSPFLPLVYRYADAMLQAGRDVHGPQKTGLLLSTLDRATPPAPPAPPADRPAAASPQHDQNLLRVLYTLTELSTKPVYRDAADAELKWLLQNGSTGEPPWDAGFKWDVLTDESIAVAPSGRLPARPWLLWDRCFELEPQASARMVKRLAEVRRGGIGEAAPIRQLGFAIRAYAVAYAHTQDPAMLAAAEGALERLEAAGGDADRAPRLSAAIDCAGAAGRVPAPLARTLRAYVAREDRAFCDLTHDLKGKAGFGLSATAPTPLWRADDGYTTAMVAMMCVSRYENSGDVRHRALVVDAADAYRGAALPAAGDDVRPMTFGHAISLQLAAWRATSRREYLDRAIELADLAVKTFWDEGPLPRAGASVKYYDAATGADTLALALVELHLSILGITAVRPPGNTIDR